MEVTELLKSAWQAVKSSKVPSELHEVAFRKALDLLTAQASQPTTNLPGERPAGRKRGMSDKATLPDKDHSGAAPRFPSSEETFKKLTTETGLTVQELEHVIAVTNAGELHILPPGKDLGSNDADRVRAVTTLVSGAARGALGLREIPSQYVEGILSAKGLHDSGNFTKQIKPLKGVTRPGSRGQARIASTSQWLPEFEATVKALSRSADEDS